MKKLIGLFILLICSITLPAQIPEVYIQQAIESNLELQNKTFDLQKSMSALKEARGMFLPSVTINARYTRAGGGREILFPVGDLVNPIHQSLNQLIGAPAFPGNIANEQIPFLREEEHETKVNIVQPLFQPKIYFNYKIKTLQKSMQLFEKQAFQRELIKNVKLAYLSYLKTVRIEKLLSATEKLLLEHLRVSESLFRNEKMTKDVVYRSEAELSNFKHQQAEIQQQKTAAGQYFNFLLNQPLTETITEIDISIQHSFSPDKSELFASAASKREEILRLNAAKIAAKNGVKLQQSSFLPTLVIAGEYGFQGEEYKFTSKDDYWMASAVARWNLFNGFQDDARIQQQKIQMKQLDNLLLQLKQKIEMDTRNNFERMTTAAKKIAAARAAKQQMQASFKIVSKKYAVNMASQIELLQARTQKTQAEIDEIVSLYDYQIAVAELERNAATYPLETLENKNEN